MRASLAAEAAGIPSVSLVAEGFAAQARSTATGSGLDDLPLAVYPGRMSLDTGDVLVDKVKKVTIEHVLQGLSRQPRQAGPRSEPGPLETVFSGSFEEVNQHFLDRGWSDGLPIVPPAREKVEEFLQFTGRAAGDVLAVLLPDKREATVWSIAVNGVMAGCRPEYMPVLVAIVEAMGDPRFGHEHLGHTPGTEVLITLNGPIIKELGFNYQQGALRVGYQANTSIGRFWRLYLRNVAGFLPGKTDKGTYGGTWRVVLAENEDACARTGWPPMSVDQGFQAGDNVVTVASCTSTDSVVSVGSPNAEEILDLLCSHIVDTQGHLFLVSRGGPSVRPQVLMSPIVAEKLAASGYSKARVRRYLYEHARFPGRRLELMCSRNLGRSLRETVAQGLLPEQYAESMDPDRLVPIVWSPEDFLITVTGDPTRDNCFICAQNGFIGYPVSKRIALPLEWKERLERLRAR